MANADKRRILVTGGAGYIGSHTVLALLERGYDVTVVDDLSRGLRHNVPGKRLWEISLQDRAPLQRLFAQYKFDAVVHFAAFTYVDESSRRPGLYFRNNVGGSLELLDTMVEAGVSHIVFSSTAAVYGVPAQIPIPENIPFHPVNPYGESKVMVERMLGWFDRIHSLRNVSLRYFNAAGADPQGRLGEEHDPETHLIPLLLRAATTRQPITVFGDDYDTPDGTCIRDYIHVTDLAEAHALALDWLLGGGASGAFNVGTGQGHSVREVMRVVEEVTGTAVPFAIGSRREGDPPALVADSAKLRRTLAWTPRYSDLHQIISTAWNFERRHATGRRRGVG
ncbi:MAG: UDP-glucose 4-epimerase GalE [Bryobacteraceae bacterium]